MLHRVWKVMKELHISFNKYLQFNQSLLQVMKFLMLYLKIEVKFLFSQFF